jgi:hypothetical protein
LLGPPPAGPGQTDTIEALVTGKKHHFAAK